DRALKMGRHVYLRVVGKARQKRDAERKPRRLDDLAMRTIVERNRAVFDFDVVERESRRGPRRPRHHPLDEIRYAVAAVGFADEIDLWAREAQRVKDRCAVP